MFQNQVSDGETLKLFWIEVKNKNMSQKVDQINRPSLLHKINEKPYNDRIFDRTIVTLHSYVLPNDSIQQNPRSPRRKENDEQYQIAEQRKKKNP